MRIILTRLMATWLMLWSAAGPSPAFAQPIAPPEPTLWRSLVSGLEPGALIAVRLKDGSRSKGTVLHVSDETFTFKARTRIPMAAREIAFTEVSTIERQKPSMSPGQKTLLGVGIGTGVYLIVTAILVAAIGFD